jgi:hypothetical protein
MKKSRYLQIDKTEKVYSSPRQEGTYLYFTGAGDDMNNGKIGEGPSMYMTNGSASDKVSKEVQFLETVFLKDGYLFWESAKVGDRVSLTVFLPANTPYLSETEQGNAVLVGGVPQYITASQVPDETWTGTHLYFPVDVDLIRFVNKFHLIGSNSHGLCIESNDAAEIDSMLKFRLEIYSPTKNPDLTVSVMMEMYRENTI